MRDPETFDAFYAEARGRLLLQTYALTGDLPASRDAVRGAFVAAWHHWAKIERRGDPEAWVRPEAWRRARRRHQARPWHRERVLDEADRRTLAALEELSVRQRKTLLLTQLSTVTTQEMAREVGLPVAAATEQLQEATSQVCLELEIVPAEIRPRLESLAEQLSGARFFRPSMIRRAGTIRRRAHTMVGVVAGVLLVLGAGVVVHNGDSEAPMLGQAEETAEPRLRAADLLGPKEVDEALAPRNVRGPGSVDNNTEDTGIYAPCQTQPFAVQSDDPADGQTLVRRMKLSGNQKGRTVQSVEVAADLGGGRAAFQRMQEWFVACQTSRAQLLSVHDLTGVGDEGRLFTLRTWDAPVTTHQAVIVRSGRLVSLVLLQTRDEGAPRTNAMLTLAGGAADRLCRAAVSADDPGACATDPKARRIPPPRPHEAIGMLQVFDLPPVRGVDEPWVGVKPARATENLAATRCDKTDFRGKQMKRARTRTFVILEAKLPKEFGITETTGRLPNKQRARNFVTGIRDRVAGCTDDDLTVTVNRRGNHSDGDEEITWWRIDTELSDTRTLTQYMAVARRGRTVAQVGFTPGSGGKKTLTEKDFDALAVRAAKRLGNMPNP